MIRSRLLREGSVGLFLLAGFILFGGIVFFLRGTDFQDQDYLVKLQFANAGGLREGARVYYRGVAVGRIIAITPSSNGVEVSTEIDGNLRIPRDVKISTLRSGLLGEVSVNVIPRSELDEASKEISPVSEDCNNQRLILCNNQKIAAESTPDLVESLAALADRFNNDEFLSELEKTLDNVNTTIAKTSTLTDEVTIAVKQVRRDLGTFTTTAQKIGNTADTLTNTASSFSTTANTATEQINNLSRTYSGTAEDISLLAINLNQLISDNRASFSDAIASLSQTSANVGELVKNTDELLANIDQEDVVKISKNLSTTSDNLKKLSEELNNPTNLATLQQTLDSARVTFANTAKITSDIDEFTGDPEFRNNIRRLVDGLSSLVSYTDLLEKQIQLANLVEQVEKFSAKDNKTVTPVSSSSEQKFPKALSSTINTNNKNIK